MYRLVVTGPRRAVLAIHTCETRAEISELMAVYAAMGYAPESLVVEETRREQAA